MTPQKLSCPFCQTKILTNNDLGDEHAELHPHCYFEVSLKNLLKINRPEVFFQEEFDLTNAQEKELGYFAMQSPFPLMLRLLYPEEIAQLSS